jgi:hypothetical protein
MRLMGWLQPFTPISGAFRRAPKSAFGAEGGTAAATNAGRGLEAFDMAIPPSYPVGHRTASRLICMRSASSSISTNGTIDWRGWLSCGPCSGINSCLASPSAHFEALLRAPETAARRGVLAGAGATGPDHRPQHADRHALGHGQSHRNSQTRGCGLNRAGTQSA